MEEEVLDYVLPEEFFLHAQAAAAIDVPKKEMENSCKVLSCSLDEFNADFSMDGGYKIEGAGSLDLM